MNDCILNRKKWKSWTCYPSTGIRRIIESEDDEEDCGTDENDSREILVIYKNKSCVK